ncbi:MAG: hypothetical protein JSW50_13220 [Candidatus Latescibacterota bacterium]|nr:MAG: hypothetical protein JSW50_13220 [Candidatus Latescibacterota bacterium]
MKKVVFLTVALVFAANMAFAQAGSVGIFGDPAGTTCNLTDVVQGLLSVYVVHVNAVATASQFSAPMPGCMVGASWLSDTGIFPVTIGNSQTGVAIGYGVCQTGNIHVLTINYFAAGLSTPCCYYPVLPDPNVPSGKIEVVDCANNLLFASGGIGIINADGSCQCDVPTEETTWGKVKSLYGE